MVKAKKNDLALVWKKDDHLTDSSPNTFLKGFFFYPNYFLRRKIAASSLKENNLEWPTAWTGEKDIPYDDTEIIVNEFEHPVRIIWISKGYMGREKYAIFG